MRVVGVVDVAGGEAGKVGLGKSEVVGGCIAVVSGKDDRYRVPETMSVFMTCPKPLFCRSIKASKIPMAHIRPPPAKSARIFRGKAGLSELPGSIFRPYEYHLMLSLSKRVGTD